jgi:hypothetical protein
MVCWPSGSMLELSGEFPEGGPPESNDFHDENWTSPVSVDSF